MSTPGVSVHMAITLMNPESLTREQLNTEFTRLQNEAFSKDIELAAFKAGLQKLDQMLCGLLEMRIANRWADLHAELDRMTEHYQEQKARQPAERKVH